MKNRIILASASPRRVALLKKIVKEFEIMPSTIDEYRIKKLDPISFARKAAIFKANDIASKHKDAVVIGADTIVVLDKKIMGKPKNDKQAISMLKALSGRTHEVITGIAVIFPGAKNIISDIEVTKVKMKKIPERQIIEYVKTGRPLDKAGAYGIQEIEDVFIDEIEGDYDNVVGLPVHKLKKILSRKIKRL